MKPKVGVLEKATKLTKDLGKLTTKIKGGKKEITNLQ